MDEGGERVDREQWSTVQALHELNNVLSAIRLSGEFALKSAAADETLREDLRTIVEAAERGNDLVQRLQLEAGSED